MYNRNHYGLGGGSNGNGPYIRTSPAFVKWTFLLIVAVSATIILCIFYSPWFAFLSIGDLAVLYMTLKSTAKFSRMLMWAKDYIDHFR